VKPRLLTVLLLLLAGAVVNVGVVWSCAYWWRQLVDISSPIEPRSSEISPSPWQVTVPADWPQRPTHEVARASAWYAFVNQAVVLEDQAAYILSGFRFGFPAKSLGCYSLSSGRLRPWSQSWSSAVEISPRGTFPLPTRPLWFGFAANTVFYAAILWFPICGPFILRRFRRIRRGLCPRCTHPMGESSVCSECGETLPKRAVA
jgi:hypothetical protein